HIAMRRPLGIEERRFVRDLDVVDEGRDDIVVPALIDVMPELGEVEHATASAVPLMLSSPRGAAMILVFGSINVDVLVPVPRLPGIGETVLGGDYRLAPGGKGANQALAARRAGSTVALAGAVGRDRFADTALALLREGGVELDLVAPVDRPTG